MDNVSKFDFDFAVKPYSLAIDQGTNSIGVVVCDKDYNILKKRGQPLSFVTKFAEGKNCQERRTARSARRLLDRKGERLNFLAETFNDEIIKTDPQFFIRLQESSLKYEDKTEKVKFFLFSEPDVKEKYTNYPTAHHLRRALLNGDPEAMDIRLVYLALHDLFKNRGHFNTSDVASTGSSIKSAFKDFNRYLENECGGAISVSDTDKVVKLLQDKKTGLREKKKLLKTYVLPLDEESEVFYDTYSLLQLLTGTKVSFDKLFGDEELKDIENSSISFKAFDEEKFCSETLPALGDRGQLVLEAKRFYDTILLDEMLNGKKYISEAKCELYDKNKRDLNILKHYVRKHHREKYNLIFKKADDSLNNFVRYTGKAKNIKVCSQEDFCKFLLKELPELKDSKKLHYIYEELEERTFFTKLNTSHNGAIPNQLLADELRKILENAAKYHPFLNEKDEKGRTHIDRLCLVFSFKREYYFGPLSPNAAHSWLVRKNSGRITALNYDEIIDVKATATNFINSLIGKCTYTGNPVIPKNSLLYSEYCVRNEINLIRVNGKPLAPEVTEQLYTDLFVNQCKDVTKNQIHKYLVSAGVIDKDDDLTGIDHKINSKLKSYHELRDIIDKTGEELAEAIIVQIMAFSQAKHLLAEWLSENCPMLTEKDKRYIISLSYSGWSALSREFLTEIYHVDTETGEAFNIMDMLRKEHLNLNQVLSKKYTFKQQADNELRSFNCMADTLKKRLDSMYISPSAKKSVRAALSIVNEIVSDIMKYPPEAIYVESPRDATNNLKGTRTKPRKAQLCELYKKHKLTGLPVYKSLVDEPPENFKSERVYLYYTQLGHCAYSGVFIPREKLDSKVDSGHFLYDVDHIFPRSQVKDDSFTNKVLCESYINREVKKATYPLPEHIRGKMVSEWLKWSKYDLIPNEKFSRLNRKTALTKEELASFTNAQLVDTRQATKALTALLNERYPTTNIVPVKAGIVSELRGVLNEPKCREANDIHHAVDAYLTLVAGNVIDAKVKKYKFNFNLNTLFTTNTEGKWNADGSTAETVKENLIKLKHTICTYKTEEKSGVLYELTKKPQNLANIPLKDGLDMSYGGYKSVSTGYFFIVDHNIKKKRVRTIEVVYIKDFDMYNRDPIKYCENVLGLVKPEIVYKKLLPGQLVSIDGKMVRIFSRSGTSLTCRHDYQLQLDSEEIKYIKKLERYKTEKSKLGNKYNIDSDRDGITAENNIKMYDLFCDKMNNTVYYDVLQTPAEIVAKGRDKFISLSLADQAVVLLQLLALFNSDARTANLSLIGGANTTGGVKITKNITNTDFAIILQSHTGFFKKVRHLPPIRQSAVDLAA